MFKAKSILSFIATKILVTCSAALPMIGIKIKAINDLLNPMAATSLIFSTIWSADLLTKYVVKANMMQHSFFPSKLSSNSSVSSADFATIWLASELSKNLMCVFNWKIINKAYTTSKIMAVNLEIFKMSASSSKLFGKVATNTVGMANEAQEIAINDDIVWAAVILKKAALPPCCWEPPKNLPPKRENSLMETSGRFGGRR